MQQQPPQDWQPTSTDWPPQPPPRDHRRLRNALIVGAWTIAVFAGGVAVGNLVPLGGGPASQAASSSSTPASIQVSATLVLADTRSAIRGCSTSGGGYSDLAAGAQVTVTDENAAVLAVTELQAPTSVELNCEFAFSVAVPPGHKFYGFEVSHRGVIRYTEAQVRSGSVSLSIG